MTVEQVVLLDAQGGAVGTAPKSVVHHERTPLHLAFSAYLFSSAGELLLSRRALSKRTFPGLWTNSVCGHPAPAEPLPEAVLRRTLAELGVRVSGLKLVLPQFQYRAEMDEVVENELCPVYTGTLERGEDLAPDPAEVAATTWVRWPAFTADVLGGRVAVSPWCVEQVAQLAGLGPDPGDWPHADPALLPPAARLG